MSLQRGYYDVFVRACAKYPSNVAVKHYDNGFYRSYTYSELYGVCEYLSQNLLQLKCTKGAIALISERNIIIPCVIAAAHKCCTTFMFLDPSQDLKEVLKYESFKVIVSIQSNEENDDSKELFGKKPDKTIVVFNMLINLYCCESEVGSYNKWIMNQHSFIAMTSGSTGEPKHIQVPVQCIQPNIDDLTKMFNITSKDVIYFSTPLTFDPSMVEILLACMNGASLLIAPERASILFPTNEENSITVWQTTPSKFFQFSNDDIQNKILCAKSTLRILALGGEPLIGVKRLRELKACENETRIFALYGVTEMSCWACAAELDLDKMLTDQEIPLGNCLSETELIIKPDKEQTHAGKIVLVSKTRQCFVLNKSKGLEQQSSLKFVDTGDFGEIRNGTIYYRGRKDDVIKRFGNKVFMQLIEATTLSCSRVKTCSCIWLPKPMLLVVYFSSETVSSQDVTDFLKSKLDETHWPDKVIRVENLPTNSHGKISKLLVTRMFENTLPQSVKTLKFNLLKELKVLISRNLTYKQIKDCDFFSIGGTSFLAVMLSNKLSLICPRFGNFILPFLMSQKHTIGEILEMVQKEICIRSPKPLKRFKRTDSGTISEKISKKMDSDQKYPNNFTVLWSFDTGKCVDASPTLFQSGSHLFMTVGSHSGKIVVFEAIGCNLQGFIDVASRVEASVLCYQKSETPARGIVGTYDGTVVCFTLEDCREVWRINVGCMIKSKAAWCNRLRLLYVALYDGRILCICPETGDLRESIHIDDQALSADLVVAKDEYILVGGLSGLCASIHAATNNVAWRSTLGSPVFASPVLYDGDKYVVFAEVNGIIHCRTVKKGIQLWKYDGAKGNIFSSMYLKEEKSKLQMVFGCHDSRVYCITIKNFQPTLQWKSVMSSPVYATPCGITDRHVLAASNDGKLCVIEYESGLIVDEFTFPNETFSSPAVYGDYIFIGCRDDHVYNLKVSFNNITS